MGLFTKSYPEEIAARLWPGRSATVEQLGGGITNHNFRARFGGREVVVRLPGNDTELPTVVETLPGAVMLITVPSASW